LPDALDHFIDPRELERSTAGEEYIPEINYAARGYEPVGTEVLDPVTGQRVAMVGPKEHFCSRCQNYYKNLADKKIYKPGDFPDRGWPIKCYGDKSKRIDTLTDAVMDGLVQSGVVEDTEDARNRFKLTYDPVGWAQLEFGVTADWYQGEMMRCSSQFKVARAGRRVGKSYAMALDIWHRAYTKDGKNKDRYEILIICPYESQVKRIFDELLTLMNRSDTLKRSYKRHAKAPWEIELHNGSIIRGFSAGRKTGAKSDKVRGQGADAIYFDEIDYMADSDIETVMASQASQQDTNVWMTSTPTGARTKMWMMCHDKSLSYKEFHYISSESPRWSKDTERMMRAVYSAGGYEREFLAEFGTETAGVFRQQDLDKCLRKYTYAETRYKRNPAWKYVLGVDWNKYTGTHLVVLERGFTEKHGYFYRVVDKEIIRRADFIQTAGIESVVRMALAWNVDFIYVDQGYGDTQVELLWRNDIDHPELGLNFATKLKAVHANQTIVIRDPRNPANDLHKSAKPFMVDLLAAWVSAGAIFFSEEEDTAASLIEEEIPFLNIGLVQQMRTFRIEKVSPTGQPRYTQGYEHTLMALCFAVLGMAENFTEINEFHIDTSIKVYNQPFGAVQKPNEEKRLEDGEIRDNEKPHTLATIYQKTLPSRTLDSAGLPSGAASGSGGGDSPGSKVGLATRRFRPDWANPTKRTIP
jgi:hypothetical protein